ncbi:MAG: hypothetical protein NC899_03240 [Candidatus Omnitrophica bacterium]|nr:hypothetical protein [Candidatus Omnitrophota bacterium]
MKLNHFLIFILLLVLSLSSENLLVPEYLKANIVYYNGFEKEDGKGEINKWKIGEKFNKNNIIPEGFIGKAYLSKANWKDGVILKSDLISPHNPISISVWWALKEDHKEGGSFEILCFNGKGFISCFVRGGGGDPWCALKKPAGVLQVYYFGGGLENINGIYHYDIMNTLNLKSKKWNNTFLVITNGIEISLYHNGKKFGKWTLSRPLTENDLIKTLSFGFAWGEEIIIDEIFIYNRPLKDEEIEEYNKMITGLKDIILK